MIKSSALRDSSKVTSGDAEVGEPEIPCIRLGGRASNPQLFERDQKGSRMEKRNKVAIAMAVLAIFGAAVGAAEDKYSLTSPGGIAFADFRGYEDWSVASSAPTDEVLKVIVGNPAIIKAYKSGVPLNGQVFPEGSLLVKLQWKPKKSTEAPFAVDVPDVFKQAFVMEKDSKRFQQLYSGYGEGAPNGRGPDQGLVTDQGKAYLDKNFPNLDSIKTATVVSPVAAPAAAGHKPATSGGGTAKP